jgi:hypothetical protein
MEKERLDWMDIIAGELAVILNTALLVAIWKIFGLIPAVFYLGSDFLLSFYKTRKAIRGIK